MSIVTVSNTAELQASLASAHGGDTILLQAGTYSGVAYYHQDFGSGVTISSADPTHQAVLTNFNMESVQGLTFSHLDMKVLTPNWTGFNIYSSQNVTFDQVHVYGPAGAPDPDVQAVNVFESSYVTVTGGAGADIFHGNSDGSDRVLDFHADEGDRVQLDSGTSYAVRQVGADTVIDMDHGGQMVLVGVQASTLAPGWIFTT